MIFPPVIANAVLAQPVIKKTIKVNKVFFTKSFDGNGVFLTQPIFNIYTLSPRLKTNQATRNLTIWVNTQYNLGNYPNKETILWKLIKH